MGGGGAVDKLVKLPARYAEGTESCLINSECSLGVVGQNPRGQNPGGQNPSSKLRGRTKSQRTKSQQYSREEKEGKNPRNFKN